MGQEPGTRLLTQACVYTTIIIMIILITGDLWGRPMALRLSWKGIRKGIARRLILKFVFYVLRGCYLTLANPMFKGHPRYLEANAGCKHFDVHGGPENIPVSRFSFNAQVQTCIVFS